MKFMLLYVLLTIFTLFTLPGNVKASSCIANFQEFYWGYHGEDLTETIVPTMIWDSTDSNQLNIAHTKGLAVFFYLQDIIFSYNPTTDTYTLNSNWTTQFDMLYGNENFPTNPYGISGLVAENPNGFFIGSKVMWRGISATQLNSIGQYIFSKYSLALLMYEEHYAVFRYGRDSNGNTINGFSQIPSWYFLVMISNYWPDTITDIASPDDLTGRLLDLHQNYVMPKAVTSFFIYVIPTYSTQNYKETSCHTHNDQSCVDIMMMFAEGFFNFLCVDQGCSSEECNNYCGNTRGLAAWPWKSDVNRIGYEVGMEDLLPLRDLEQYFGSLACTLNPASTITVNVSVLLFSLLIYLIY